MVRSAGTLTALSSELYTYLGSGRTLVRAAIPDPRLGKESRLKSGFTMNCAEQALASMGLSGIATLVIRGLLVEVWVSELT